MGGSVTVCGGKQALTTAARYRVTPKGPQILVRVGNALPAAAGGLSSTKFLDKFSIVVKKTTREKVRKKSKPVVKVYVNQKLAFSSLKLKKKSVFLLLFLIFIILCYSDKHNYTDSKSS